MSAKIIAEHVIERGQTLSGIALKYYGSAAKEKWMAIVEANPDVINPETLLIRPGWVIKIPNLNTIGEKETSDMDEKNTATDNNRGRSDSTAPRLSRNVPEPTSYTGKYFVELPFKPEDEYFLLDELSDTQNDELDYALKFFGLENDNLDIQAAKVTIPSHPRIEKMKEFTICAWIKSLEYDTRTWPELVSLGRVSFKLFPVPSISLQDPQEGEALAASSIIRGVWQHVAVTFKGNMITHYLNGQPNGINTVKGEIWQSASKTNNSGIGSGFSGLIDQVQIWDYAFEDKEINYYKDSIPSGSEDGLVGCWLMNEGVGTTVHDISANKIDGEMEISIQWVLSDRSDIQNMKDDTLKTVYNDARNEGILHPSFFPYSKGFNKRTADVKKLFAEVPETLFKSEYKAGKKMRISLGATGEALTWTFVRDTMDLKPKMYLVETYRLSSFLGAYGTGRTVRTFSLLPGEKTKISISSYKKSTVSATSTSSIFDSVNEESTNSFNKDILDEQSETRKEDESLSWHVEGSAEAKWGVGSAKVSGGAKGSSNASREAFAKGVSNVTNNHAAKASAKRDVQVNTSSEVKTESGDETAIQRDIENINVSRTLNFIFRQMNQEYITLLHLVDVKVGFSMAGARSHRVSLSELDELLEEVVVKDKDKRDEVRKFIIGELEHIRDFRDNVAEGFVQKIEVDGDTSYYRIKKDFTSTYVDPATGTEIEVPGIIINEDKVVMRTEDVLVDAVLGDGDALDAYSQGLQTEAVRAESVQNEFSSLKNRLLQKILDAPDKESADAATDRYQKIFTAGPNKLVLETDILRKNGNLPLLD